MDLVQRLIVKGAWLALFVVAFFGSVSAYAAGPAPDVPVLCYSTSCVQTIKELCAVANQITPREGRAYKENAQGRNTCDSIDTTDGHVQVSDSLTPSTNLYCGVSTKNPPAYSVQPPAADGTCPAPSCGGSVAPDITGAGGSFNVANGNIIGGNFCDSAGCQASGKPSGSNCVTIGGTTSCQSYFTGAVESGASCTQAPPGPADNTPHCGPGLVLGSVNGNPTCLPQGAKPAPPVVTTGKTTGAPSVTSQQNADGSTTTTTTTVTTTTNADGSVTTTTDVGKSTSPAGGGPAVPGGTSSSSNTTGGSPLPKPSDPVKDVCTAHPELNMCKNSTVAGLCKDTTCDGDAIQCAQLAQERQSYCDATDLTGADAALGAAIASGADPKAALLPSSANASSIDLAQAGSSFDMGGFLGSGGTCLPDFQYTVMGGSGSFSFDRICGVLSGLRLVVMLAATLFAYRMVSGVILREV